MHFMLGIGDTNTSTAPSDIISTNLPENNSELYFNYCIYIFSDLDYCFSVLFLFNIVGGILYLDIIFFISIYLSAGWLLFLFTPPYN